jgi:type II secretory ATPase GspE/PulE/Tfp pilus assembly ATPase PilB-like protein
MAKDAHRSPEESIEESTGKVRPEEATLGIEDAMGRLSLSRSQVYRLVIDGNLNATKIEARLVFCANDIEAAADLLARRREEVEALLRLYERRLAEHGIDCLPDSCEEDVDAGPGELVRRLLLECMAAQASDYYVMPTGDGDRLLMRVGGNLGEVARVESELGVRLKSALKDLAPLPETGEGLQSEVIFSHAEEHHSAQVRLRVTKTMAGEQIHLQLFHAGKQPTLAYVGYTPQQDETLRNLLTKRPGLVVLAGGTVRVMQEQRLALAEFLSTQGKLVVAIDRLPNLQSANVVHLDGRQSENGNCSDLWEAALGLSPDVIMVDRVENEDEVESLVSALAVGTTILLQVPTTSCVAALQFLIERGFTRRQLARYFRAASEVVLLPKLCLACREPRSIDVDEARLLDVPTATTLFEEGACSQCEEGSRGSRAVWGLLLEDEFEFIDTDDGSAVQDASHEEQRTTDVALSTALRHAALAGDVSLAQVAPYLR